MIVVDVYLSVISLILFIYKAIVVLEGRISWVLVFVYQGLAENIVKIPSLILLIVLFLIILVPPTDCFFANMHDMKLGTRWITRQQSEAVAALIVMTGQRVTHLHFRGTL